MSNVNIPYLEAGLAAFDQLDQWTRSYLFTGADPEAKAFTGFAYEQNQTVLANTPLALNARNKLVPATNSEVLTSFVANAVVNAGGSGGTNGAAVVTGTTGTGTKFQADVTIAGGAITAVNDIKVEGSYSVAPTTPAAEPVTGGGLTGATLTLTMETLDTVTPVLKAQFISTQAVTTAVGQDNVTAPVWYSGCFNIRALNWDASFASDTDKYQAFYGAPTPTTILIKKRQSDL